ncbi:MAG TPA: hypothetical protein VF997_20085, partial [Polyangia bacterium]
MIDSTRGPLLLVALLAACGGANAPGDLASSASADLASSPSDDLASSPAPDLAGGGGADLATATGGCTMPTSGYYVIGAASSTGPGVKLYLVGKGADGWDKELGDILLNGQPVSLDYLT